MYQVDKNRYAIRNVLKTGITVEAERFPIARFERADIFTLDKASLQKWMAKYPGMAEQVVLHLFGHTT